jgi:hypothetical protein
MSEVFARVHPHRLLSFIGRCCLAIALVVEAPSEASAQSADTVTAEALFQEGRSLLDAGNYREACVKLAESHRLDPATGTLLALAVCHEQEGKLASAWAEFTEALGRAKEQGRADREQVARERAEALRPRLSTLHIEVSSEALRTSGLEIRRDGIVLGGGAFNLDVPIDGGEHVIEATAPGKTPWRQVVTIGPERHKARVSVPVLVSVASPATAQPAPAPTAAEGEKPWGTLAWVGVGTAGAGVVALGVGGVFLAQALGKKSDSEADCDGNECGPDGLEQREDAVSAGNVATGFGIAGFALVGTGAILFLVGSSGGAESAPGADASLRVDIGRGGFFADVVGNF